MNFDELKPGAEIPHFSSACDIAQSFLYNAALWNAHRIHFDLPYTRDVEGYPGLVVPGPLMGDWITQAILSWAGDAGELVRFEYSNRRACYVDDAVRTRGRIVEVDPTRREVTLEVQLLDASEQVLIPSRAVVRFERFEHAEPAEGAS